MNLFELFAKISFNTDEAEAAISSFGGKIKSGIGTAAKIGGAALAATTAGIVAFAKSSVDAGMQFDSSMSQVAATMGTTVDQIGELRDFAMEMGATTAFSATQAADALNYMALAGYDAEESMQALPNVLNLAAAGGIELAAASDMVTDAQSALGLSMEESAELVDQMAMASSKSNTSVAQLGEAILTVGGTAKNLAGGTTELSTALGILADNGVKGAEGGTALRNIILSLSAPTDKAAAALKSLGVEAFDADGNMRPLNETFGDLDAALSQLSQQEKTQALNEIFNKVDLKSVEAMLANTGERFDELSGYIDNAAGAAENMAAVQLDNLAGDITLFKSALEGAQITLSDELTPSLRDFVQFGTEGITSVSDAFKEGGLSGAMAAFGEVISSALTAIIEKLPLIMDAGAQLLKALVDGILQNLPLLVNGAMDIILSLASGLSTYLPELVPTVVDIILQIVTTLIDNVDKLVDAAIAIIIALAEGIMNSLPELLAKAPEIVGKLVLAIIENAPKLLGAAVELISTLISGIGSMLGEVFSAGAKVVNSAKDGIMSIVSQAAQWGRDLIQNFIDGILAKWNALKQTVSNVASSVKSFIGFSEPEEGPLSNFHTYAPDMMALFAQGIKENEHLITDQIKKSFDFGGLIASVSTGGNYENDNYVGGYKNNYGRSSRLNASNGSTYNFTFNSPKELSISDANRQARRAYNEMVLGF